jgi:heme O synthase-like polyprenyltransferase
MDVSFASLIQTFDAAGVADKWAETAWAKKIARTARRASLNDFERFVVHVTKQKVCWRFCFSSVPGLVYSPRYEAHLPLFSATRPS